MSDRPGEGYTYRYSQIAKKLLQAKGGEPLPELAQELVAGIILENDRAEWYMLGDSPLWVSQATSGALAANNSGVGVRSGAGIITVITDIIVTTPGVVADIRIGTNVATPVSTGAPNFRDSRTKGTPGSRITTFQNVGEQGSGPVWFLPSQSADPLPRFVLSGPTDDLVVWHPTVNTAIQVAFAGYERPVEGSER